ncbi:hypothetical protein ABZ690_28230 [Streptomyces sp. NPDC006967]
MTDWQPDRAERAVWYIAIAAGITYWLVIIACLVGIGMWIGGAL